ncbi:hypothetical protein CPLU01_09574 [Colletotrichum plurivorum]|uniref:Uncharacterized protein n=1 Tax=Colletotrichum plurivorum TaxID=2175906 RepID=A0A8H6NBD1_9PEZI|nr:hypothetical protein CPLU01_09574 [Colletotrichum plurivorum]
MGIVSVPLPPASQCHSPVTARDMVLHPPGADDDNDSDSDSDNDVVVSCRQSPRQREPPPVPLSSDFGSFLIPRSAGFDSKVDRSYVNSTSQPHDSADR